jgi:hypothetical protein
VWSPRGDAIFYRDTSGQLMRVTVQTTPTVTLGTPTLINRPLNLVARAGFDISPDGTRMLIVEEVRTDDQRKAALVVVQNWLAGVRR